MKTYVRPYNMASASAKGLAHRLGALRIRRKNSAFKGNNEKIVINWGCPENNEELDKCYRVLNKPDAVETASDKLKFFNALNGTDLPFPGFTTDYETALDWLRAGDTIVCRQVLRGHSGEGIVLAATEDELVEAPLYTRYIPKKSEFRIHVVGDSIVDITRKARMRHVPDANVNWKVRNLANGFTYAREDTQVSMYAKLVAKAVIRHLGLDFGAVDMIYNHRMGLYFILEVNTAPGLMGNTLEKVGDAFENLIFRYENEKQQEEGNDPFDIDAALERLERI